MPNTCCDLIPRLGIPREVRPPFACERGLESFEAKIHRVRVERCIRCNSLRSVKGRVGVRDLHANVLHRPGLDLERLTHRYSGGDFWRPDVSGELVGEVVG